MLSCEIPRPNGLSLPGIFIVAAVFTTGCGGIHLTRNLLRPQLTIPVSIAADANENKPIAFDLVEVNDKDLAKQVSAMTAADWFQKRDQIRKDFPKTTSITVLSWEWVPGQVVPDLQVPMRRAPRAVLIFAYYSSAGPHRISVDPAKPQALTLAREDVMPEALAK